MRGTRHRIAIASILRTDASVPADNEHATPAADSGTIYAQLLATFQPVTPADIPPSIPAAAPSAQPPVLSYLANRWTRASSHGVPRTARTVLGLIPCLEQQFFVLSSSRPRA